MTTPIIDERMLLKVLDCTANYEHVERLQQGALMTIIDAYDREVTRDEFITIIQAFSSLVDSVGRLALLHNVKQFVDHHGQATPADIERAQAGVTEMAQNATKVVAEIVERLRQCPLDEDRIH